MKQCEILKSPILSSYSLLQVENLLGLGLGEIHSKNDQFSSIKCQETGMFISNLILFVDSVCSLDTEPSSILRIV